MGGSAKEGRSGQPRLCIQPFRLGCPEVKLDSPNEKNKFKNYLID